MTKLSDAQIRALAIKLKAEVAFTIKIRKNQDNPTLRGIFISRIANSEMLSFARAMSTEFSAAFYVKDQETGCYRRLSDDDAWSVFKMAFPFDDTDYSHIGQTIKSV